jgi:DNA-3-methyladenine glycosylase
MNRRINMSVTDPADGVKVTSTSGDRQRGEVRRVRWNPIKSAARIHRLRRSDLPTDTVKLARFLIGKTLVRELARGRLTGRIVEVEAYPIGDAAGHAFRGHTPGNHSIFLEHGRAYVYFIYGSCFMLNVSGERPGVGGAVLLRALEPLEGMDLMKRHRGIPRALDLARGPGRLASAMQIDRRLDGVDLCAPGPLWLGAAARPVGRIGRSVRIGVTHEMERKLRLYERGNPFVSGPKRLRM